MEAKKSPSADVNAHVKLYRSLGLMISLSLVVTAFEWKNYDAPVVELQSRNTNTFEQTLEIPPTEQAPPPPPVLTQAQIIEVADETEIKDELKVSFDLEITEDTKVESIVIPAPAPDVEETEQIFTIVEQSAYPKGGLAGFYQYVKDNIRYPAQAKRMAIQGRVFVEFVISKDGSSTDVHVVKGIGAGCDEEAVRIVAGSPSWNPGRQRGKPVHQRYTLPIIFKMGSL
jgi:protein TonB